MSGISTHVLDTATGVPVTGIPVYLFHEDQQVGSAVTNENGRCPALFEPGHQLQTGIYRIRFDVAAVYPNSFYPLIEISFRVSDPAAHYHVPLLLSPFGFTTYRGS